MKKIYKIIGLIAMILVIIFWQPVSLLLGVSENGVRLMHEYLKIIFALPSVILIISFAVLFLYKDEIRNILKRLKMLKFGSLFQAEGGGFEKGDEENKAVSESEQVAVEMIKKKKDEGIEKLEREYGNMLEREYFRYLSIFLDENAKKALLFFKDERFSTTDFLGSFSPFYLRGGYTHEQQKHIILDALLREGLLLENGDTIYISDKGKRFLEFIGW